MNTIEKEIILSQEFEFEIIENTNLVALTKRNVALVEAMIRNDSAYLKSSDKNAEPIYKINKKTKEKEVKYGGSTAYWVNQFKNVDENISKEEYFKLIFEIVSAIDRENSTHLNSDGVGREQISERIANIGKSDLINKIKDKTKGIELINEISLPTKPTNKNLSARKNYSFATKFCHYMSFYLFDDENQDNYSIYDGVLDSAIKKYIKHYNINIGKFDFSDYKNYLWIIDKIRELSKKEYGILISRNGFDHLIWYYFKGRN